MAQPPAYTVHEADVERDRGLILSLWSGNLGQDARMARKYDWFYRHCPFGAPLTLLLRHEESGDWVGVASAGPRPMWMDGRRVLAGVLVDLAVASEHRSLGPALMLQMALMEAGLRRFDLLYGFPNPKAAAVFKRVGYASLGALARHARVLRHAGYVRRRLPAPLAAPAGWLLDLADRARLWSASGGLQAQWHDRADASGDMPWSTASAGQGPVAIRDVAFRRWRLDECPLVQLRHLQVRDGGGNLVAWFACEAREHGLHVVDAWTVEGRMARRRRSSSPCCAPPAPPAMPRCRWNWAARPPPLPGATPVSWPANRVRSSAAPATATPRRLLTASGSPPPTRTSSWHRAVRSLSRHSPSRAREGRGGGLPASTRPHGAFARPGPHPKPTTGSPSPPIPAVHTAMLPREAPCEPPDCCPSSP